jgi:hypothetical protein
VGSREFRHSVMYICGFYEHKSDYPGRWGKNGKFFVGPLFENILRKQKPLSQHLMRADAPMPPVWMNPAAPDGAPPRRINRIKLQ